MRRLIGLLFALNMIVNAAETTKPCDPKVQECKPKECPDHETCQPKKSHFTVQDLAIMYWVEHHMREAKEAWSNLDSKGKDAFKKEINERHHQKYGEGSDHIQDLASCLTEDELAPMYYGQHCMDEKLIAEAVTKWDSLSKKQRRKFHKKTKKEFAAKHKEWMDRCSKSACKPCQNRCEPAKPAAK